MIQLNLSRRISWIPRTACRVPVPSVSKEQRRHVVGFWWSVSQLYQGRCHSSTSCTSSIGYNSSARMRRVLKLYRTYTLFTTDLAKICSLESWFTYAASIQMYTAALRCLDWANSLHRDFFLTVFFSSRDAWLNLRSYNGTLAVGVLILSSRCILDLYQSHFHNYIWALYIYCSFQHRPLVFCPCRITKSNTSFVGLTELSPLSAAYDRVQVETCWEEKNGRDEVCDYQGSLHLKDHIADRNWMPQLS